MPMLVCSSACSHPLFLSPDVCRRRLAPLAQEWRSFRARLVALETEHSGNLFLGDDAAPSDNLPWRLSSFLTPSPPPPAASSATRLAPPPGVQAGGHTPAAPAPASGFTSTAASQAAVPSTSAPANNSVASSNREGKTPLLLTPNFCSRLLLTTPACARCRLLPKG